MATTTSSSSSIIHSAGRILVNEWIASVFVNYLQISTPETAIVNLSADFLDRNAHLHIQLGRHRLAIRVRMALRIAIPGRSREGVGA